MVDIAAGLAVAAQAIGLVKDLREIDKGLDAGEYKAKMAELYGSLADVKMALAEAQETLKAKDAEIQRLAEGMQFRADLMERHGFKYPKTDDGGPQGRPYCPRCEENRGRFYMLTKFGRGAIAFQCPECKAEYHNVSSFLWQDER